MHIKEISFKNLKSIAEFNMSFDNPAGWHVLIGDNGSGKSTILKGISSLLLGSFGASNMMEFHGDWIRNNEKLLSIESTNINIDENSKAAINVSLEFKRERSSHNRNFMSHGMQSSEEATEYRNNLFSCAFGPFRRFSIGNEEFKNLPNNILSHLSLYEENAPLTKSLDWMRLLRFQDLENNIESKETLTCIKNFINHGELLPYESSKLTDVRSDGVYFMSGNEIEVNVHKLGDGYKAILSLILEMIRLMVDQYGNDKVFTNVKQGDMTIPIGGIVLIDEIDAHLHPTWQTRIGEWFTKYFPNIQFIVTTHSPLICRACEKGSIWRLAAPGTKQIHHQIVGKEKDILVYGDVLEAYETNVFGDNIERGTKGNKLQKKYRKLKEKKRYALEMSPDEIKELEKLKRIFHTNVGDS